MFYVTKYDLFDTSNLGVAYDNCMSASL